MADLSVLFSIDDVHRSVKEHSMSRPDPFLNLLKDIGYLPLRLPRADVEPLQLLNLEVRTSACREVSTKPWTPVQPNCRPSRQTSLRPDRSREPTLRPSNLASV
jgi:hypothetical protein